MEEKKHANGKGGKYLEKKDIFFGEEKKNGEGKGGKYWEKENIFFCRVEKNGEGQGGKYDGEGKIVASGQTGWTEIEGSVRGPRGPNNCFSRTADLVLPTKK